MTLFLICTSLIHTVIQFSYFDHCDETATTINSCPFVVSATISIFISDGRNSVVNHCRREADTVGAAIVAVGLVPTSETRCMHTLETLPTTRQYRLQLRIITERACTTTETIPLGGAYIRYNFLYPVFLSIIAYCVAIFYKLDSVKSLTGFEVSTEVPECKDRDNTLHILVNYKYFTEKVKNKIKV